MLIIFFLGGGLYVNPLFLPHREQIRLHHNSLLTLYSETVMPETMDNVHHCRYDCELIHINCKNRVKDLNTLRRKIKIFFVLQKGVYLCTCLCILSVFSQESLWLKNIAL